MRKKVNVNKQILENSGRKSPSDATKNSFFVNFLAGFFNFFPSPSNSYSHSTGGGFRADSLAMKKDFQTMAIDMRKALDKYEQNKTN